MRIILITLIISVLPFLGLSSKSENERELENTCGRYCLKVVNPTLEHTVALQKKVSSLEDIEKELKQVNVDKVELLKQNADYQSKQETMENELSVLQKKIDEYDKTLKGSEQTLEGQSKWFEKIGSKYYYIEQDTKLNWYAAAQRCHQLGAHLASIQNQNEFDAIKAKLKPPQDYWIDVNDLAEEGKYMSLTTGNTAAYFNWISNNPDNNHGNEDCGSFCYSQEKYGMNDYVCTHPLYFICETFKVK